MGQAGGAMPGYSGGATAPNSTSGSWGSALGQPGLNAGTVAGLPGYLSNWINANPSLGPVEGRGGLPPPAVAVATEQPTPLLDQVPLSIPVAKPPVVPTPEEVNQLSPADVSKPGTLTKPVSKLMQLDESIWNPLPKPVKAKEAAGLTYAGNINSNASATGGAYGMPAVSYGGGPVYKNASGKYFYDKAGKYPVPAEHLRLGGGGLK